jgi:hypothetical protein
MAIIDREPQMTKFPAENQVSATAWRARDVTGWLALAASPTFALMASTAAHNHHSISLCSPGQSILPIDGMAAMYVLMSLFHLSPWLKLTSRQPARQALPNQ